MRIIGEVYRDKRHNEFWGGSILDIYARHYELPKELSFAFINLKNVTIQRSLFNGNWLMVGKGIQL